VYNINVKKGAKTILNEEEEQELVNWILKLSQCGFPVTKNQLLDSVQNFVKKTNKENPFTDGRPSRHWYNAFLKRHPELSQRMSQNLTKSYLNSKNLLNIESTRIFNVDESSFLLSPKVDKIIVKKGSKNVYNTCNSDKECYTALIGGSAAGTLLPPMIIYNYERIPKAIVSNFPSEFVIGKSESGWMTSDVFYSYVVNHFYTWCVKEKITFPIILYVDGHSSHMTMALSDFCCSHQIELVGLVANATHIHQPMDVGLFHPLKTSYKKEIRIWRKKNRGQQLTKIYFPTVLKNSLNSLDLKKIFENSFRTCGLYPFSAESINYNKLMIKSNSIATATDSEVTKESNSIDENCRFIESHIKKETLEEFKNHKSIDWTGNSESKDLFDFWKKCKNLHETQENTNKLEVTKNAMIQDAIEVIQMEDKPEDPCLNCDGATKEVIENVIVDSSGEVTLPLNLTTELLRDGVILTNVMTQDSTNERPTHTLAGNEETLPIRAICAPEEIFLNNYVVPNQVHNSVVCILCIHVMFNLFILRRLPFNYFIMLFTY